MSAVEMHEVPTGKADATLVVSERLSPEESLEEEKRDETDMHRMGKTQELMRNFRFLSITAFTVVAQGDWLFITTDVFYAIDNGGTGGIVILYLLHSIFYGLIIVSLAEMASMAPTAGGQYHWVSEFAPPKYQRLLSYTSGWLAALSWIAGTTSCPYIIGYVVPALASLTYPNYVPQDYQGFLLILLLTVIGTLVNTSFARLMPKIEGFAALFTALSFTCFLTVLWALGEKVTAGEVFGTFTNNAGWSSMGLSLMVVQSFVCSDLSGSDAAAHMSEEVQKAGSVIPKAMVTAYTINAITVIISTITFFFCLTDIPGALNSSTGYPFVTVFYETTGSAGGAIALTSIICVSLFFCFVNNMASTSRQVFAFARDQGLPFSGWLSKVDPRTNYPVNSIMLVAGCVIALAAVGLGSDAAYNAIISLYMFAMVFTYSVSIGCLIWRRLYGEPLPPAAWSLGRYGIWINCTALTYCVFCLFWFPWPQYTPIDASSFNWAIVEFAIIMGGSSIYYFMHAQHQYKGPAAYVRKTSSS